MSQNKEAATSGQRDGLEPEDLNELEIYKLFRKWRAEQKRPRVTDAYRAGYLQGFVAGNLEQALSSSTSGPEMQFLNVADVSRVLVERTNGILWKDDADGNMARLTDALNELLQPPQARMQEPSK